MARGDQIYVMRPLMNMDGAYEHHGIDCGDGTVIHYYKGGEVPTITRTSFATFARGNPVYPQPQSIAYLPEIVIQRAESRLGEQKYQLLTNNCEHFATWCKTGRNESPQLLTDGLGYGSLNPFDTRQMLDRAATEGNPVETVTLLTQALNQATITRQQLQSQANQAQAEMASWHRVAQAALKRNREDLARAALARKVNYRRKWEQIQKQLQDVDALQTSLLQNTRKLQQQIAIDPHHLQTTIS
ncbi:MAG: lecithin retinol acyltransferase family protein [Elainella sp. Prado103]|jgi:hypothetical protein|nr:lecithin retinol acyltransferase family protein [Elainella sp. Prado103]